MSLGYKISPATWIGDSMSIIGEKTLKEITLPGTHDSGAYYLTEIQMPGDTPEIYEAFYTVAKALDKPVGLVAIDWALTQRQDFYTQMQDGIRFFDLRSGWLENTQEWVFFHYNIGVPVQILLQDVYRFLVDYPTEIVVIEMSHFDGSPSVEDINTLKTMVINTLGVYLYPVNTSYSFTINQMISSGKRAIVTMEEGYDDNNIWPPEAIYNTYADSPKIDEMMEFNDKTVQDFMTHEWPNTLFKVSWTLTPDNMTVIDSLEPLHPHTLLQLADTGNRHLHSFWLKMKKNNWRMGNILIIDDYEHSDIISVVWDMNNILY